MNTNKQVKNIVMGAIFASIIYVTTAFLHIPSYTGYLHIGDGFIYLVSCLLPTPYAIGASAIGAGLSDGLSGYVMWIIPSVIIKSLTALCFSRKTDKIICKRNILALIPSFILCVGGYYLADAIMTSNFIAPLSGIFGNVCQVVASSILFILLGLALDRMNFKKRI